jgi:hypothetical protein
VKLRQAIVILSGQINIVLLCHECHFSLPLSDVLDFIIVCSLAIVVASIYVVIIIHFHVIILGNTQLNIVLFVVRMTVIALDFPLLARWPLLSLDLLYFIIRAFNLLFPI